jgi:hypothetical protein
MRPARSSPLGEWEDKLHGVLTDDVTQTPSISTADPSPPPRQSLVITQLTCKCPGGTLEAWPELLARLYKGLTGSDENDVYSCRCVR